MFRGDGGISLVGKLEGGHLNDDRYTPVNGCFYDVLDSKNQIVYSKMQLNRIGRKLDINLTVAPRKESYTIAIYCYDKLVKKVITSSANTEPTDFGIIQVTQPQVTQP